MVVWPKVNLAMRKKFAWKTQETSLAIVNPTSSITMELANVSLNYKLASIRFKIQNEL